MRHSLKTRFTFAIVLFVVVMNFTFVIINFINFNKMHEKYSFLEADTVANTCVLTVDGDNIGKYRTTLQRDSDYYEVWNRLIDYRNTNNRIVKLSMVYFDELGCHYIFDTDLTEKGAHLGDYQLYDSVQEKYKEQLIAGNYKGYLKYKNRMDLFKPIVNSYNITIGYIVVGISNTEMIDEQISFLIETISVLSVGSVILALLFSAFASKTVIKPINSLSNVASNYINSLNGEGHVTELENLDIHTGDEIEKLYISVKKMVQDILNSSNNLLIANWNSNHDSMTQLFNKRHYHDSLEFFNNGISLGVIFMDIDNLKLMNDTFGHEAGDLVIMKTAEFIQKYTVENSYAYRLGGDEFAIIIWNIKKVHLDKLVKDMRDDVERVINLPVFHVQCRISIGYSYASQNINASELMKLADESMYEDKYGKR